MRPSSGRNAPLGPGRVDIDAGGGVLAQGGRRSATPAVTPADQLALLRLRAQPRKAVRTSGLAPSLGVRCPGREEHRGGIEPPATGIFGPDAERGRGRAPATPIARETGVLIGVTATRPGRRDRGGAEGSALGPRDKPTSWPGARVLEEPKASWARARIGRARHGGCRGAKRLDVCTGSPPQRGLASPVQAPAGRDVCPFSADGVESGFSSPRSDP